MHSYDVSHFDPPVPVALVTLRNPASGVTVSDVVLLVDSGADITLLPRQAVARLGITPVAGQGYELAGCDGRTTFAAVVTLEMIFLKRIFRGQYLLIEEERGVLDRDVLNHVALLLDGPHQRWYELAP